MSPIEPRELDQIANEIYPMADLPDEWKTGDNGEPALNWVAAIHRSRAIIYACFSGRARP